MMRHSLSFVFSCLLLSSCQSTQPPQKNTAAIAQPSSYLQQAQRHLSEGKAREAEEAARKGLQQQESPVLYVTLGMALLSQNKLSEAQAAFAEAIRLSPSELQPALLLATTLEQQGRWEEAAELYLEVLQRAPGHPIASMGLAQIFLSLGATEEAITALETIRWKEEPKAGYFAALGSAYFADGRSAEAEAALSKAWQLEPTRLDYFSRLCQIWIESGALEIAERELTALLTKSPEEPVLLLLSAQTLYLRKQPTESLSLLVRLLGIDPNNVSALALQGKIYLSQSQYGEAILALTQAILIAPNQVGLLLDRGLAYEGAKQRDDAAKNYEAAKQIAPKDPRPWLALAELWQKEKPSEALAAIDELLLANPEQKEALLLRASILIQVNRFDDAISTYEEALRQHPDSVQVNNNFAWALVYEASSEKRDCQRGLKLALQAVALSKAEAAAELDTLAEAYRCVGDFDNALQAIDKAIAKGGSEPFFEKHRAEIREAQRQKKNKPSKKSR